MKERTSETLQLLIMYFEEYHEGKTSIVPSQAGGNMAIVNCNRFSIAVTMCQGHRDKWCIKLEEILVKPEHRKQGIATDVLDAFKVLSDTKKVKIGLWVRRERGDLINFYLRRDFIVKEKINDYWMEYN